jgi:hypothetical protein
MLAGAVVWWISTPSSASSTRAFVAPVPGGVVTGARF